MKNLYSQISSKYKKMFSISEIESSPTLYIIAWVLLLGWFVEFAFWSRFSDFTRNAVEAGRHLCWPFFQQCGEWYILAQEPLGASHYALYAILFAVLLGTGYALIRKHYAVVHALFFLMFLWEFTVMLMSMRLAINYWYFHIIFAAIFLFPFRKLFFLRFFAVLLYFFSGILKLTDSWTQGLYFSSLVEGLYFIPDALIPVATNAVIFMELVLVWFLLSSHRHLRLGVLAVFSTFHLYSIMYIGYIFPSIVFPTVLVLFLSDEQTPGLFTSLRKNVFAWFLIGFFLLVHSIPYFIAGDVRVTGEGNRFGMYMFEANYQCSSLATVHRVDESAEELSSQSFFANYRCDPYAHYFYLSQLCQSNTDIESIDWKFDTSINGRPLQRIVDVENACALTYLPFVHNEWIRLSGIDEIETVGAVGKNRYHHGGHEDFRLEPSHATAGEFQ